VFHKRPFLRQKNYYEDGTIQTVTLIENHLTGGTRQNTETKHDEHWKKSVELTRCEPASFNSKAHSRLQM